MIVGLIQYDKSVRENQVARHRSIERRPSRFIVETQLNPAQFVRIHVSAIVNLAKVQEIRRTIRGDYQVTLAGGRRLPVSRRRRKELIDLGVSRFGLKA